MKYNQENLLLIASIIHGATSALARPDGSLPPAWNDLSEEDRNRSVQALEVLFNEPQKSVEEHHDLWCDLKIKGGWTYGPEYCDKNLTHPCLIPFDQLIETEQLKDKFWYVLVNVFKEHLERD